MTNVSAREYAESLHQLFRRPSKRRYGLFIGYRDEN